MRKKVIYSGVFGLMSLSVLLSNNAWSQVTPQQIAMMKNVTSSKISSDGQYIAYTVSIPTDPKTDNVGNSVHLYILNTKTGESRELHTSSSVSQIDFRPQSNKVTFLTKEKSNKTNAIYEIDAATGQLSTVYQYNSNIVSYTWHPDAMTIAFVTTEKAEAPKTSLTYKPTFFEEEFPLRPAYVVNTNNPNSIKKLNVTGDVYLLKWSPDGQKLAFSVAPTSSVDDSYMAQSIKIADAQNLNVIAHVNNKGKLSQIEWSPNSDQLAIVGAYDLHDPTSGTIHLVSAQGGNPITLDGQYLGKYESIIWKDKNEILFHSSEGVSSAIGKLPINGKEKMYIFRSDAHQINGFSASKIGELSFTASTPEHPSELFTVNEKNRRMPLKRTQNNEWLTGLKLGRQEIITYKARDGRYDIQGLLIYPIDYKAGTTYPLITVVHGGPESHFSNGWITSYSNPGQMGASKGYMVFYPNYRGSTGRGIDFTYSSQGDLAGKEFDDIVDGVDYLIQKGLVDKNRVGVTGGSYGGYASAWMSTYYSDRFAAAVMFVGISNNISKFGTSDIPTEMKLVHERADVWDDWQKQLEISPIYHVDKAQTPILIMHGAEDPRVHPAQSMELYRHLKVRKPEVPVRLIYYPGEGHGNGRSGSKYDYNLRMMQWFDTYLKSGNRQAPLPSLDLPE